MNEIILANKIKCNHCDDEIESKYRHDFVTCSCGKVSVDGGKDYLKRSFTDRSDYTEISEYEEEEIEIIYQGDWLKRLKAGDIDEVVESILKDDTGDVEPLTAALVLRLQKERTAVKTLRGSTGDASIAFYLMDSKASLALGDQMAKAINQSHKDVE